MSTQDAGSSLVPFAERVRGLQVTRVGLVVLVVGASVLGVVPDVELGGLALACVAYLLGTALTLRAPRWRRGLAIAASSAALLVDGLFLAATTYVPAGIAGPAVTIVLLHCVAVTLLASFRTGLKVTVWHTLVLLSVHELSAADVLGMPDPSWQTAVVAGGALWIVTLSTAAFAAVNEREIRRRNFDLLALSRLALRL